MDALTKLSFCKGHGAFSNRDGVPHRKPRAGRKGVSAGYLGVFLALALVVPTLVLAAVARPGPDASGGARGSLSGLPIEAQAGISAALGRDQAIYHARQEGVGRFIWPIPAMGSRRCSPLGASRWKAGMSAFNSISQEWDAARSTRHSPPLGPRPRPTASTTGAVRSPSGM